MSERLIRQPCGCWTPPTDTLYSVHVCSAKKKRRLPMTAPRRAGEEGP